VRRDGRSSRATGWSQGAAAAACIRLALIPVASTAFSKVTEEGAFTGMTVRLIGGFVHGLSVDPSDLRYTSSILH
jgi:hypothetical protein